MAEHIALKKKSWGTLTGAWVPHEVRDQIVDFVRRWSEETEIGATRFIEWLAVAASKFYSRRERYGRVNEHSRNRLPPSRCSAVLHVPSLNIHTITARPND